MLSDETGKLLHDRTARGKPLISEENELLEKWYNQQDKAESQLLKSNTDFDIEDTLQKQIDTILIEIKSASDNIQRLTNENKVLKNDITNLQNQLAEKMIEHSI